jgi:hypothetical protein
MRREWSISNTLTKLALLAVVAVPLAAPCNAQDMGDPDTCRFTSGTWVIDGDEDSVFSVELWGWLDDPNIIGGSLPFKVSFDTTGFDPVEWNVHMDTYPYVYGDYSVWVSTADSFIIVDTFVYDPDIVTDARLYNKTLFDHSIAPSYDDLGYNGLLLGLVEWVEPIQPIFETGKSAKVGDLFLKITDPGRLPDSFNIEVDSFFYPCCGYFKYSPAPPGAGFAPVFTKSVISVVQVSYVCGDADVSGDVDIDDAVYLIAYIFSGGPPPEPTAAGDADCSGDVDIDDVVYLIAYIFSGGNYPCDTDGDSEPDC